MSDTDNNSTPTDINAELARLRAENERLTAKVTAKQTISFKIGDKGGLSVYGLGRFPTTLYRQQWERLLAPETVEKINAFIKANAHKLAVKE